MLDAFSIADAYLTTILNWAGASKVDLQQWPEVHAYYQRMLQAAEHRARGRRGVRALQGRAGDANLRRSEAYFWGAYAMHSTSTRALRARPLAASALRAGKGFLKNSA